MQLSTPASSPPLYQNNASVSHTGDTTETTLATINVPAGAMGANGLIKIAARFTFTGTNGTKTVRLKIGSTTLATLASTSAQTGYRLDAEIFNTNATNAQFASGVGVNNNGSTSFASATASIDTTAATTITITGQLGNAADSIALVGAQALLVPHS